METVLPEDTLYRRLSGRDIKPDGSISSQAFYAKNNELSVDLARLTTPGGSLSFGQPGQGIGGLVASVPFDLGLSVAHDPDYDNGNMAHCLIGGMSGAKGQRRQLAAATAILIKPGQSCDS